VTPPRLQDFLPDGQLADAAAQLDRFLAWVSKTGLVPYAAQEEALLELSLDRHVVLSTPTGSGKSLVALGLHFRALCEGRRSFYTAPTKALVSEKFFSLCDEFGAESVGMLTGDASINRGAPIICCTAEVLANMALQQGEALDAPHVVMDEFHYYGDRDRGVAWQIPLLVLKHTQFLLMSATLGNTARIEEGLRDLSGRRVVRVHDDVRPVPLDYAYFDTPIGETIENLLRQGRDPIYVVHFTQREATEKAQALCSTRVGSRETQKRIAKKLATVRFDTPFGPSVRRILRNGIGLHHAGLLPRYRLLVEQLAQEGLLRVVCGTDTLGVGVNIPIRTVLFSALSKFDGEKVRILSARDFKQISGRAGRRGFDDRGSVICQAPEHVIENRRAAEKARGVVRKRRAARKRPPPRGFVGWNAETFESLIKKPPETLESRFRIDHGILIRCLQADATGARAGAGYRRLAELVGQNFEPATRRRQRLREAAVLFRSLRRSGVVELVREDGGPVGVRVHADLQKDFSLHQVLSLYLVEACAALDPDAPDHTLDVLSLVEAILENPRAILMQQLRIAKRELMRELKANRVPFEERIAKLDAFQLPRPNADFISATFAIFAEHHPWVGSESVRPKSIAREMAEHFASFDDMVRHYELGRMEGGLLRYLTQVYNTLVQTVPGNVRTESLDELIAWLRALITRVDSSLLDEWESRRAPSSAQASAAPVVTPLATPSLSPHELQARARAELHQLVEALSRRDYDEALRWIQRDPEDPWDAARIEAALRPFYREYESIRSDPPARQPNRTLFRQREGGRFDVHHMLLDDLDENHWNLEGRIDAEAAELGEPLFRLRRIGT